jgi:hypothetical protein
MWRKSTFSGGAGMCVEVFRKSSFSGTGGSCVDVARPEGDTLSEDSITKVRDTKDNETGPVLSFTEDEWQAFINGVKAGEFD